MPVLLMEPVSSVKRRRYFEILAEPKGYSPPTLTNVKKKLKEIRHYSLDHLDALLTALTASLSACPGVEVTLARDAVQAVEAIQKIAGGSSLIAVNKSAVVGNELVPALTTTGYGIIESYYDEFDTSINIASDYWQLPAMPFESRFQSFGKPVDLIALRSDSLRKNGAKDFIGLLGVNAVSAEDGAVLMLQHMHNIRKVFEQAQEIILVAGIDKIVKNRVDAVFQTQCMAAFGVEVLPLTIGGRTQKQSSIDELPYEIPLEQASSRIHLILLDNGRSQILKGAYRELLTCIDCQACAKSCPTSSLFAKGARWSPRAYIYFFLTGKNPSLDLCLQCQTCEMNCPLDIDLPGKILTARTRFTSGKHRSLTDTLIANAGALEYLGSSTAWFANSLSGNRPLRWVAEKVLNISRHRQLPGFHHQTFARWFASRKHSSKGTGQSG